jgi:hypothetical protein
MLNEYEGIKSISSFETNKIANSELIRKHKENLSVERIKNRLILPNLEKLGEDKTNIDNEELDSNINKNRKNYYYIKDVRKVNINFPFNGILQLRGGWKDFPSFTPKKEKNSIVISNPEVPKKKSSIVRIFQSLSFGIGNMVQWVIVNPFLVQLHAMWGFIILIAMYKQIFLSMFTLLDSLSGGTLKKISDRLLNSLIYKRLTSIVGFLVNPAIDLIYSRLINNTVEISKMSKLIADITENIIDLQKIYLDLQEALTSLNSNQIITERKVKECNLIIEFFLNHLFKISQLQNSAMFMILSETASQRKFNKESLDNQARLEKDFRKVMSENEGQIESIRRNFIPIKHDLALMRSYMRRDTETLEALANTVGALTENQGSLANTVGVLTENQGSFVDKIESFGVNFISVHENLKKIKAKSNTFAINQNQLLEGFTSFVQIYEAFNKQYSTNQEGLSSVLSIMKKIKSVEVEKTSADPSESPQDYDPERIYASTVETLKTSVKIIYASIYASFSMNFGTQFAIVEVEETKETIEKKN